MRSKELWLVEKNHATVKLDSSVALERRFSWNENLQRKQNWTAKIYNILKKMLDTSSQFLSSEQPSEPKSLDVALNIAGVEKIRSENLRLRSTRRPFDPSFERKTAPVTVEICVFGGRWFSNQFEIVSETPFSCDTVGREL